MHAGIINQQYVRIAFLLQFELVLLRKRVSFLMNKVLPLQLLPALYLRCPSFRPRNISKCSYTYKCVYNPRKTT